MLICHCRAVNERTVEASILAGARGTDDVADMCGAGGQCGGCISAIEELLEVRGPERDRATVSSAA